MFHEQVNPRLFDTVFLCPETTPRHRRGFPVWLDFQECAFNPFISFPFPFPLSLISRFCFAMLLRFYIMSLMLILLLPPPAPAPAPPLPLPLECECELPGAGLTDPLCCIGAGARWPGFCCCCCCCWRGGSEPPDIAG
jgi:hypothetical protein